MSTSTKEDDGLTPLERRKNYLKELQNLKTDDFPEIVKILISREIRMVTRWIASMTYRSE